MSTDQVESLWERLEPLLSRVQKPARYIGCEDGAQTPDWAPVGGRSPVSWLFIYPDTYEIGLPNQGLQILYEIVNERPDAWPSGPTPRGSTSRRSCGRPAPRCSASTPTVPPGAFDLLAFNLSAELTYTNLLNCVDLADVPVRADRAIARPSAGRAPVVTAPTTPSPWPTSSTSWCWATARRSCRRSPPWWGTGRHRGATRREDVLRELCRIEGVYVPAAYEVSYDGADLVVGRATLARGAGAGREADHRGPRRVAVPHASSSSRSPRWCTTA